VKKPKPNTKLTPRQEAMLKKHSVHHTTKHMTMMRRLMKNGTTFSAAHKKAQKKESK